MKIEITDKDALLLASFHREFSADLAEHDETIALRTAMNTFFEQVCKNLPEDRFTEACAEIQVDVLLGRAPDNDKLKYAVRPREQEPLLYGIWNNDMQAWQYIDAWKGLATTSCSEAHEECRRFNSGHYN